eukprot:35030-Prymnesium_polylepis.1
MSLRGLVGLSSSPRILKAFCWHVNAEMKMGSVEKIDEIGSLPVLTAPRHTWFAARGAHGSRKSAGASANAATISAMSSKQHTEMSEVTRRPSIFRRKQSGATVMTAPPIHERRESSMHISPRVNESPATMR